MKKKTNTMIIHPRITRESGSKDGSEDPKTNVLTCRMLNSASNSIRFIVGSL